MSNETRVKANEFDGRCCCCGCAVPAGTGLVVSREGKREFGRWVVHTSQGRSRGWTHRVVCRSHADSVVW